MRTLTVHIGIVNWVSLFMKMRAARNSFQEVMKAKRMTVTIPAFTAGIKIRQSTCQLLQPSMTPASSSSFGIASKEWRIR